MITEHDLQEAIAECEGQRNPTANTCIKLAAFYTIKQHMFGGEPPMQENNYSFASSPPPQPDVISYDERDSDFVDAIQGMRVNDLITLVDEIMTTLSVTQPRLYDSVMRKLRQA